MKHLLISAAFIFVPVFTEAGVNDYYSWWRDTYLKESKRIDGGAFVDYQKERTTCSEAMAYGMLISVFASDENETRAKEDFAALYKFQKSFRSNIDSRLMAWRIDDKDTAPVDTTCATDGDMDIAYALATAARKWGDDSLMTEAKQLVKAIEESLIRDDFSLRRGDWDKNQHSTRLSDIMPSHFRLFAELSDAGLWEKVEEVSYSIIEETMGEHGVFPDFVIRKDGKWIPAPPKFLESENDGSMYYNSCRVPWRLAWSALENKSPKSKKILAAFNQGIGKASNENFKAGYNIAGEPLNEWTDGAFTAPHMCSLLVNQRLDEYRQAFDLQLTRKESYYQDSIRLLCLYLCTEHQ